MTILIVVDTASSALATSARARKNLQDIEILIATDYSSPRKLIAEIERRQFSALFFTWRACLYDLAKCSYTAKALNRMRLDFPIGVLVPDYIGLQDEHFRAESELLNFCDFYYVTNKDLHDLYENNLDFPNPTGILHDMPNVSLIREKRMTPNARDSKRVIWVGNSHWGKRQGFTDHKGFKEVVVPLQVELREHGDCFHLMIIDSHTNRMSQSQVFDEMLEASFVIQTSISEGTGLPILEGMGLGLIPLSTKVGVFPELNLTYKIMSSLNPDYSEFHNALHWIQESYPGASAEAMIEFERFVGEISNEKITYPAETKVVDLDKFSLFTKFKVNLIWKLRFLRSKIQIRRRKSE
jgi:glycosyltransferase involved in cell wall biosynthesis